MIPKHFVVFGRKIRIKICKIDDHTRGQYWHQDGVIDINEGQSNADKTATVFHELVHAMFFASGLDQANISHDAQEIMAEQFAKILMENVNLKKR